MLVGQWHSYIKEWKKQVKYAFYWKYDYRNHTQIFQSIQKKAENRFKEVLQKLLKS